MNDYTIYSEDEYYDKTQLLSIYSPTVCTCIWEEICKYRQQFRYDVHFRAKRAYITLNKTLYQKMIRIYELRLEKKLGIEKKIDFNDHLGAKDLLLKYIKDNKMIMTQEMFQFLTSNEFLLLKVFIIYNYINDLDFLYLFLCLNQRMEWFEIVERIELSMKSSIDNADLTKDFRDFLDSFYFLSSDNVIQLISTVFEPMDVEELLTQYPTCSKKQMLFYTKCAKKNHYYTIAQYMEMNNVSYETARKAMEHLVELKFYRKIKVGKKFVFTPVD